MIFCPPFSKHSLFIDLSFLSIFLYPSNCYGWLSLTPLHEKNASRILKKTLACEKLWTHIFGTTIYLHSSPEEFSCRKANVSYQHLNESEEIQILVISSGS
jgi:hypothetical protein